MTEPTSTSRPSPTPAKIALASLIGTTVEWYDFGIYSTAAALVFGQLFFPELGSLSGTIASFATYFVGSLARPLGAAVFGHIGDRAGRKAALVASLLTMGVATFFIGLLPTHAAMGTAAPLLLVALRIVQSLAVGGEWGGAVLIAVEHAPKKHRTFFGSFPQLGSSVGLLLSSGAFALVTLLDHETFVSWGWRIPFLASALLVVVGLVVRYQISESPEFQRARAEADRARLPLLDVVRTSWRALLLSAGAILATIGIFALDTTYIASYATSELAFSESDVLTGSTVTAVVSMVLTPVAAWLADRFGARMVVGWAFVQTIIVSFPLFWFAQTGSVAALWTGMTLVMIGSTFSYAPIGALVSEWFPTRVRYTGISISYQVAGVLGDGLAPLLATALYMQFDGSYAAVAAYMIVMTLVSLGCVAGYRGRYHLDEISPEMAAQRDSIH